MISESSKKGISRQKNIDKNGNKLLNDVLHIKIAEDLFVTNSMSIELKHGSNYSNLNGFDCNKKERFIDKMSRIVTDQRSVCVLLFGKGFYGYLFYHYVSYAIARTKTRQSNEWKRSQKKIRSLIREKKEK